MKQGYSLQDLVAHMKGNDISTFINNQSYRFKERFGLDYHQAVTVHLHFKTHIDAQDFYTEVRFHQDYAREYRVKTCKHSTKTLIVSGAETLYDYFGSREPNLLTVSRDLGIGFDITFVQAYSGTVFTGTVHCGELLSRQCIIEVSSVLPELSLGGLVQIGRSQQEFDDLLTRCYIVQGQAVL